jgi:hypothetical protein
VLDDQVPPAVPAPSAPCRRPAPPTPAPCGISRQNRSFPCRSSHYQQPGPPSPTVSERGCGGGGGGAGEGAQRTRGPADGGSPHPVFTPSPSSLPPPTCSPLIKRRCLIPSPPDIAPPPPRSYCSAPPRAWLTGGRAGREVRAEEAKQSQRRTEALAAKQILKEQIAEQVPPPPPPSPPHPVPPLRT